MLDTNIAIYARDGVGSVLDHIALHRGAIILSALSLADLRRGVSTNTAHPQSRKRYLDVLLRQIPVVPFDAAAADSYGEVIAAAAG